MDLASKGTMETSSLLIAIVLLTPTLSAAAPSTRVTPEAACRSTLYPALCRSILPPSQGSQPLSSFSLLSASKSLSTSHSHLSTITHFLHKRRPSLSPTAVFAVQDCLSLAHLSVDFLRASNSTLDASSLSESDTAEVHTLLSSSLTNLQTCLDGLSVLPDPSVTKPLSDRLSNGTMLFSVALALFSQSWVDAPKTTGGGPGRRLMQAPSEALVSDVVVVSQDGSGNFTTISDAVNSARNNSDGSGGYYLIRVKAGVYAEYVSIPTNKRYLMMVGDGINLTVVTGNRSVADGWTTFNSATFAVVAQGFVAINMTFQNTAGAAKHQAVALRSGADLSTFYRCSFEGYQDTLYTHSMRQFYRECHVYGTVDFIFGNAAVVLQNCSIYARLPMPGQSDPVTAQGRTDPNQNTGTSIHGCSVLAAPDLAASNGTTKTYLGRPWKEYSRVVVMQSFLDGLVDPAGWLAWNGDFALSTLYYAEHNNTGSGSGTSNRVAWPGYHVINGTAAADYTVDAFLFGGFWLPQTGVPYTGGLL